MVRRGAFGSVKEYKSLEDINKIDQSTNGKVEVTTTRIVDLCLGLEPQQIGIDRITRAWRDKDVGGSLKSLNQTNSYAKHCPFFCDAELKKVNQPRDPLVQLAMWQAAAYQKRRMEGWDQAIPMPGLVITGDRWLLYIGFAEDDGVVC